MLNKHWGFFIDEIFTLSSWLFYLYNMRILQIALLIAILTMGCKKSKTTAVSEIGCDGGEVLTLKDLTGLDGCSWVFEQANGNKLEPTNLAEQLSSPENKQYRVIYKTRTNGGSICMVGNLIEIVCIEAIN